MNARRLRLRTPVVLFAALALVACGGEGELPPSGVLVTLDTTNYGALDVYGKDRDITPALDSLAAESVIYDRAYTTTPMTLPSHTSMLTGLYPLRHGVRDNGLMELTPEAETLAEMASDVGFETAAFIAAKVISSPYGLAQGFDHYDEPGQHASPKVVRHIQHRNAPFVTERAVEWLKGREDKQRPFFMWVHYFDPHLPYEPPPQFLDLAGGLPYLGEVASMDASIAKLLEALRSETDYERLMIAVVADHGEAFGRHGEPTHCAFIYDDTVHIPFILRFPHARRAGERSEEIVSVVDLLPTFAEELGLVGPDDIDGLSLSQPGVPEDRGVYVESYTGYLNFGWSPLAAWVDSRGKYLHSSNPELYDLNTDPKEMKNLIAERPEEAARLRRAIAELQEKPRLATGADVLLSEEQMRDLRALGYAAVGDTEAEIIDPLEPCDRPAPNQRVGPYNAFTNALHLAYTGQQDEAIILLKSVIAENPNNLYAQEILGGVYIEAKRHDEALEHFEGLITAGAARFAFHASAGWLHQQKGNLEKAEEHFMAALTMRPTDVLMQARVREVKKLRAGE